MFAHMRCDTREMKRVTTFRSVNSLPCSGDSKRFGRLGCSGGVLALNSGAFVYSNCLRRRFWCSCAPQAWGGRVAPSGEKTQAGTASRAGAWAWASGLFIRYGRGWVAGAEGSPPTSTRVYSDGYS
ncbi:hypothetical protein VIGAN_09094400 [Vigna angularis var. angularis]|uniref:Uncharacterized protein n=1 Tax=Vigna angularis var. angularis TaxID=157739 RepID=A0A0S3SXQ6_PHAAN|nr:hypothetical protein VIGAN_09094400 [Vigna angularis var. angularis]